MAECIFPPNFSRCVYVLEDSEVDPENRTLRTRTWNLNHNRLMTVVEECLFQEDHSRTSWTRLSREAWILSNVYSLARPIQEFGLARFKSNHVKAMKGLEYALSQIQAAERDQGEESEKHKPLPHQTPPTSTSSTQNPKQFF
ncbi:hypothetical protein NQZ68_032820 [Dissostichus eleginoides]|nr:hypothetical protein NQZ68_032820 [Dissostichus eleginoides]